jgi:hypothetical protein
VPIGYPALVERGRQRRAAEPRLATRAGKRADVHELDDLVLGEDAAQLRCAAARVTDRPERDA